jgi:hypothetical protein
MSTIGQQSGKDNNSKSCGLSHSAFLNKQTELFVLFLSCALICQFNVLHLA